MTEFKFVKTQDDLEKSLNIRRNVFINEMGVPESIELDGFDTLTSHCKHILVLYNGVTIGTARCNLISETELKIQRFCFLPEYRKSGYGKLLLEFIEREFSDKGYHYFFLEAKFSVHEFYEKCGYKKASDIFIEANVPHIKMEKSL
ncbi:MAG: GNAT family N-acetyltransferase [Clostridia bacterium]|nr:GNAT family N-acetyltransferase [Clostridia bacterium]